MSFWTPALDFIVSLKFDIVIKELTSDTDSMADVPHLESTEKLSGSL